MSCEEKCREAAFFLELLDAVEHRNRPLTRDTSTEAEISFLLGAFLNSVYAALELAKASIGGDAVKVYKRQNSALLGGSGLRNFTVHQGHANVDRGYAPPPGNTVSFYFRHPPLLCEEEEVRSEKQPPQQAIHLIFRAAHFIQLDNRQHDIATLCFEQHSRLRNFLLMQKLIP